MYIPEGREEELNPSFLSLFFDRIPFLEAIIHLRFHLPRRLFRFGRYER